MRVLTFEEHKMSHIHCSVCTVPEKERELKKSERCCICYRERIKEFMKDYAHGVDE